MPATDKILRALRKICLSLPDTKETLTWGKPHFRVGGKIFAGYGEEQGRTVVGFKLTKDHAATVTKRRGFTPAPYVGRHGWVSMDTSVAGDTDQLRSFVLESYRLIAPKKTLAKLERSS